MELTQDRLKELLHYDPLTGLFTSLKKRGNLKVGDIAGAIHKDGGVHISIGGKLYKAHRLAFLYMDGKFPAYGVDHKNGIRNDNRWDNLRKATQKENAQNTKKHVTNTSGYPGVRWSKQIKRWTAFIHQDGKQKHLGTFATKEEAYAARLLEQKKVWQFQPLPREGVI